FSKSWRYVSSIRRAKDSSSTTTSSSQLPNQLATLRFDEPTRAQFESATAVFACSIVPFHSNTRTPASSKGRYPALDKGLRIGISVEFGTSKRTSTPSF